MDLFQKVSVGACILLSTACLACTKEYGARVENSPPFKPMRTLIEDNMTWTKENLYTDLHIGEEGLGVHFTLHTWGLNGERRIPVDLWFRYHSRDYLLGRDEAIPPAAGSSTTFNDFVIFIPYTRLHEIFKFDYSDPDNCKFCGHPVDATNSDNTLAIYVRSPDDQDTFIGGAHFYSYRFKAIVAENMPHIVWTCTNVRFTSAGDFEASVQVDMNEQIGNKDFEVILLLQQIPNATGSSIKLPDSFLIKKRMARDSFRFKLSVPASILASFPMDQAVMLSPVVREVGGDTYVNANISIPFFAGGSVDRISQRVRKETDNLDMRIQYWEKVLEILRK